MVFLHPEMHVDIAMWKLSMYKICDSSCKLERQGLSKSHFLRPQLGKNKLSHLLYLFTVSFIAYHLIKHNTPKQIGEREALRIDCKLSDWVELNMGDENGDIGCNLLRRAYESIIFMFVGDDGANGKVDAI